MSWLYEAEVGHRRLESLDDAFTHRLYLWLVDLDDLPRLPALLRPFARFRAADHIGAPRPHDPREPRRVPRRAGDRSGRRGS